VKNAPQRSLQLKADLKNNQEYLETLRVLQPTYDTYQRLAKTEIPKLEADIKSLASKLAEASQDIDQVGCPFIQELADNSAPRQSQISKSKSSLLKRSNDPYKISSVQPKKFRTSTVKSRVAKVSWASPVGRSQELRSVKSLPR